MGVLLWAAMLSSGVHSTIAGIVVAFVIPIRPKFQPEHFINRVKETALDMHEAVRDNADIIHNTRLRSLVSALGDNVRLVQAPAQRMEYHLHLPVAYLVIPLFALANAGIPVDFAGFERYLQHPVTLGVLAGLLLGKPVGIVGLTWLTVRLGWAQLPGGLGMKHIVGVGLLGGIGFTMRSSSPIWALPVLPEALLMAKTGILLGSALAGCAGILWLLLLSRTTAAGVD